MWKQRAVTLCAALAILPLVIGCSVGAGGPPQAYTPQGYPPQAYAPPQPYVPQPYVPQASAPVPAAINGARVYAIGPGAPAAILVMLPGPGDVITANPQLWTAQGFDVVTPTPSELYRFAAEQEKVTAQLIAQAEALTNAPIWVVGPNPAIETAMASLPAGASGQVSGVVMTSTSSGAGTCSERMIYSYSGNGTPQVSVSKSGNACPPGSPFGAGTNSTMTPHLPLVQPHAPRLIEASAPASAGSPAAQQAVRQIADLIKSAPPG
ncbi:MAG: hypothetical protein JO007_18660 [Alphaproteobacteria bacterium]|nr:hypothetical protein [Alphaproteobacteria bacterium]